MSDAALRYAEVLLTAAKHENAVPVVTEEMKIAAHGFDRCSNVFSSPVFPVREQLSTVNAVIEGQFHPLITKFIFLLIEMRRLGEIKNIAEIYEEIAHKEMGQVDLHLTVFEEPASDMVPDLIDAACKKGLFGTGYRDNVNIRFTVDKSLMGGFTADCDGKSWDCSLVSRFGELSKMLRKG